MERRALRTLPAEAGSGPGPIRQNGTLSAGRTAVRSQARAGAPVRPVIPQGFTRPPLLSRPLTLWPVL